MSLTVRFFDPGKEYLSIKGEIDTAMQDVLARGDLILRRDVEEFEEKFAAYVGAKYAVGVASGTDALILALKAAGISTGDEVLVPSYTFRATVEAVVHAGGVPVLYDLDGTLAKESTATFCIPAHIAGEIMYPEWLDFTKHVVIEDAAQAIGSGPVRGLMATYSFYPAKILGCYGDGGAIATNDKELYEELKIMRNHYKGDWRPVGYNSRLDNLQAAVLNVKLKYLPQYIERRKEIALRYDHSLSEVVGVPAPREVYQDYIIELDSEQERDNLYFFLKERGIETLTNGYPFPSMTPKLPKALAYESRSLRLPCNPQLTNEEVEQIIESVHEFIQNL